MSDGLREVSIGDALRGALEPRPRLARRAPGGIDVYHPGGRIYDIDDARLQSAADVAMWVRQLGEKTWVTKQHLIDFAQAVLDGKKSDA